MKYIELEYRTRYQKFFVAVVPLIILISDILFRLNTLEEYKRLQWVFYSLSLVYSVLLYSMVLIGLRRLYTQESPIPYRVSLGLATAFYTSVIVGSYGYFSYTGIMPNFFVFSFLFNEPFNSWTIFLGALSFKSVLITAAIGSVFCYSLWKATSIENRASQFYTVYKAFALVLLVGLTAFLHNNTRFNDQVYVSDTNTIAFTWRNLYNKLTGDRLGSAGLQSRNKPNLNAIASQQDFNILFVVAESLRKKSMNLYGYSRDTTPNLNRMIREADPNSVFVFERAYSNSSSTLLSFPSIVSGVSPAQSISMTHSFPLFWEYAKVANFSTFYISSHSLTWNNFEGFFKNSGIDKLWAKETSGLNSFNDIGVDDRETIQTFKNYIKSVRNSGRRFAGVLHFNTNHFPYYVPKGSETYAVDGVLDQYDNSVHYFDSLLQEVFLFLDSEGVFKNTLVIFTSDHGESLFEHNYLGHIDSNYVETIAIPMIFYFPPSMRERIGNSAFRRNTKRIVANTDLIPTVLDILHLENRPDIRGYSSKLEGKSLLRELDNQRKIIVTNNNEISLYKVGLSYLKGNLHYLMNVNTVPPKEQLFDLSKDPNELNDLWTFLNDSEKKRYRSELENCQVCVDLLSSANLQMSSAEVLGTSLRASATTDSSNPKEPQLPLNNTSMNKIR
ncbi:sulfatase [Leptospira perolatii]|uniref:Sulfatase n=1 Tax=Leptospira perolatii TaxID=2023191 RepID=A0A2M9ZRY9_9LEPT|nr:sulfatase-like hydrolase/transferase [Leptospira perolatii]PJZ71160.1 sulfatase [Leptospira perolatii]PJZ74693.1 sulfatase [Leptospira perolatii]